MNYSFARIAGLVLAFGLFISCNTFQTTSNPTSTQELTPSQLRDKISSIDQQLATDSTADLLYQKGKYLIKLAQKIEVPEKRTSLYTDAQHNLQQTTQPSVSSSDPLNKKSRELLNVSWSREHNSGVQLMQSDSTLESSGLEQAAAHFKNATVIIPDSAISYKMGARAYYRNQNSERAIAMLETAKSQINNIPVLLLEQLAFLYLENNQSGKAIEVYEEAEAFSQGNLNLLHGLANAYIKAGNHKQAITLLSTLVEQEPENIIYKQSLGTELYYLASVKTDSIQKELASNTTTLKSLSTVDSLLQRAQTHLAELTDQNPENLELKKNLAQFYYNSAASYQQLLPFLESKIRSNTEQRIDHYLTSSIPLFEELVKQQPNQKEIWQNLYQTYSYLGMQEQARNAKSNL